MADERSCPECGMISTDWWQCQCEQEVSLRDEAAREADIEEEIIAAEAAQEEAACSVWK